MHPTRRLIIHHRRSNDQASIQTSIISTGTIQLDPPGFTLRTDDVYDGLT